MILRETKNFVILKKNSEKITIKAKGNVVPKEKTYPYKILRELVLVKDETLDMICVFDFGIGVFRK